MNMRVSKYQLEFQDFGADRFVPMAFPEGTSLADVVTAAETMIDEGKARWVRVYNREDISVLHSFGWSRAGR